MNARTFTAIGLASLLALSCGCPKQVLADDSSNNSSREGFPGRRLGGGTRGECLSTKEKNKRLTALVPANNLGVTVAGYPTLFFYVPTTSTPTTLEFVLQDEDESEIYEKTFTTPGTGGIIKVSLPASATLPPLAVGKKYRWVFSMVCPTSRADDVVVDGGLERVTPEVSLAARLEKASPQERVALYASADLWNEALVTLAELRRTSGDDAAITAKWTKLLQSVGLDSIVREPVLPEQILQEPVSKI